MSLAEMNKRWAYIKAQSLSNQQSLKDRINDRFFWAFTKILKT